MISAAWLRKRQSMWARLDKLVHNVTAHGLRTTEHAALRELALLYRQTAADLATVRADASSPALAAYLNQLLGRAHNLVYQGERRGRGGLRRFLARDFPREVRASLPFILGAAAWFAVFGLAAWVAALADDGLVRVILSPAMRDTIDRHEMWTQSILGVQPAAASGIMTNNMTVSFLTFASGITGGVLTAYLLAFNGVLMGVVGAACHQAGMTVALWSFVAPHGSLELPAIFVAGGAGLIIARGMLFPGLEPRRLSLEHAARRAVRLMLGTIPMLVIAGLIEGFVSPSLMPAPLKFAIGALMFTLLVAWIASGGRGGRPAATPGSAPSPAGSR